MSAVETAAEGVGPSGLRKIADLYLASCFEGETPPQVNELAALLGLEPHQLADLFRELLGSTPSDYLKHGQVSHAQLLLRTTSLSLNAIAYASGFGTRATFYRAFHRVTGTTPGAYRAGRSSK